MRIIWLGHSGFRIEIAGQVLLIDPWLKGNPMFPEDRRAEAIAGATHILLSHGHGDHAGDAVPIARELGIPIVCMHELADWWASSEGVATTGFNKGGTLALGEVNVTMVNAVHSSSVDFRDGQPTCAGSEAGYMIAGEFRTIYFSGDTDVTADMEIFQALHAPEIGILCAGGLYTMDMRRAAWAAKRYFDFRTVIPCHYRTFPALAQDADELKAGLPGIDVIEPQVLETIDL